MTSKYIPVTQLSVTSQGSTVGRFATEQEKGSGNAILKDLDITRRIIIGNDAKKKLIEQLEKDAKVEN
jgi:hypothetical protein